MTQSGRLRNRVTIQNQSVALDDYNEPLVTWVDLATIWADIRQSSARERERMVSSADQLQAATDHVFIIRWRNDISTKQRIRFGTRIFDVEGFNDPTGKRHELRLDCREVLS